MKSWSRSYQPSSLMAEEELSKKPFAHAALIGTGLIGGSLALAMRAHGLADKFTGYDPNQDVLSRALKRHIIDSAAPCLEDCIEDAELIIIAAPVGAVRSILAELAGKAPDGAVIIDVGSTKGEPVNAGKILPNTLHFVPCHPVAGTEQSGPDAAFSTLFEDRWCILTPYEREDASYKEAVERVSQLWRAIGARVEIMDASHHDLALAVTSHLPHLIAFTLVVAADDLETVTEAEIIKYSAGGFRDFTRIAASDPVMWRDVFLHNREGVIEALGRFIEELMAMQRAIRWGDGEALHDAFARGRALRQAIIDAGQENASPNFGRND